MCLKNKKYEFFNKNSKCDATYDYIYFQIKQKKHSIRSFFLSRQ